MELNSFGYGGSPEVLSSVPVKLDKSGNTDISKLTPAEIEKYSEMNKSLQISDVNSILNYGADVQNSMERYSTDFLSSVRTFKSGEVGVLINDLLGELNYIDISDIEQTGFKSFLARLPLVGRMVVDIKKVFQKYDLVVDSIDQITSKIKTGGLNSMRDNESLQAMFENNVIFIKQMEDLIISGQLKYTELLERIVQMENIPAGYEDYEIADTRDFANRLDKRLNDMKTIRYVMMQSLAQIRLVQNNNTSVAEKAQSIVSTTIPIWKNQLTIAISLQRQKANVDMQRRISETTNTILLKNAEMLKQNSIDVARENEKTVVTTETLKKTTNLLIETLTEVKKIHDEGTVKRAQLGKEVKQLETELKKNVTQTV